MSSLLPSSPLSFQHSSFLSLKKIPIKPITTPHTHPPSKIRASSTPFLFKPSPCPSTSTSTVPHAGRSKKTGRIEGSGDLRRQAKRNARRRSRRLSQNLFYRRNNPSSSNHPDSFTEAELNSIGLGYDRAVRFMSPDDPNLRHPHDYYKYGKYGPYSWRGIVVGPPVRGRFSDDRVSIHEEVSSHEEFEKIEQFEMSSEFSPRLQSLDSDIGFKYYWVFVRHPRWTPKDSHPWEQWTLVCEVAVESAPDQRLDKWSLIGRLGNQTRRMVTQCAAWERPDIIYVKKPVYQCRFEPQSQFFQGLIPLLDPATEGKYVFEAELEDGRVERGSYFAMLCKMVKVSPKAYVDDVVNAYERLGDEGKSRCLEFLLRNNPVELLHPWTREWKAKLEEEELGCDAPDGSDDEVDVNWEEEEESTDRDEDDDGVIDVGEKSEEEEEEEEEEEPEERAEYWEEQWKKAMGSNEEMEKLVKKSIEVSDRYNERKRREEEEMKEEMEEEMEAKREEMEEMRREILENLREGKEGFRGGGKGRRVPPELFLRAAVRPFTYRNLVKEIVLMRHAIVDGDVAIKWK